jgi:hypothetical protein
MRGVPETKALLLLDSLLWPLLIRIKFSKNNICIVIILSLYDVHKMNAQRGKRVRPSVCPSVCFISNPPFLPPKNFNEILSHRSVEETAVDY